MKRLAFAIAFASCLYGQVPSIANEMFPQFRTDLNTSLGLAVSTSGSYANPSWLTSFAWGKLTGVPTFEYQIFLHDGTAVTPRANFNLAAGSNITITASDNGTTQTTFTIAGSAGGSGCAAAGSAGVVQGSNGSGGCAATSITDNGSTVTTTEPVTAPSATFGAGPVVTGTGIIAIKENTGQGCADSGADCLEGDSVSHRLHIYNNGTVDGGAVMGASTADIETGKTFDTAGSGNSLLINGLAATANTGTGAVVRANSPALVTPALGTPASGVLTNATALPWGTGVVSRPWTCKTITGDPGAASPALANDNDSPVACGNNTGFDVTVTAVSAYADAGSPTVTPILTGGSGTSVLTGALTAGTASWAAGTVNGTVILHSFSANGATCSVTPCTIDSNITTAGGTAKYLVVQIVGTY